MSGYYNPMGCDGIWRARTDRIMPIAFDDTLSVIQCVNMLKNRLNEACEKIWELSEIVGNWKGSLDFLNERRIPVYFMLYIIDILNYIRYIR